MLVPSKRPWTVMTLHSMLARFPWTDLRGHAKAYGMYVRVNTEVDDDYLRQEPVPPIGGIATIRLDRRSFCGLVRGLSLQPAEEGSRPGLAR